MPGVCNDGDGILHSPTLRWPAAVLPLQSAHRALPSLLLLQRCLQPPATAQAAALGHSAAQNMALHLGCQLNGNLCCWRCGGRLVTVAPGTLSLSSAPRRSSIFLRLLPTDLLIEHQPFGGAPESSS